MNIANTPPPKNAQALWNHYSDTYFSLRMGLAVLAFAFPAVLYGIGKFGFGLDLQPSMSAYFFTATAQQCASFPMRTLFVGFLFAIGAGLYLYKGFTPLENLLLNAAGVCAATVAIFPERIGVAEASGDTRLQGLFASCPAIRQWAESPPALPVHYLAAVLLFALLAVVAWACACKTLAYLPPAKGDAATFRRLYRGLAILMLLCPVVGLVLAYFLGARSSSVFFVEAAAVWTFGTYWAVKSRELALSRLEKDPQQAVRDAPPAAPAAPPAASSR